MSDIADGFVISEKITGPGQLAAAIIEDMSHGMSEEEHDAWLVRMSFIIEEQPSLTIASVMEMLADHGR